MIEKIQISDASIAEVIRKQMAVATATEKGLVGKMQAPVIYELEANAVVEIELPVYGIYLFVSETMSGTSLIFQKAYSLPNFKILLDVSNIQDVLFNISQVEDGSKIVRVRNLSPTLRQKFSISRI